MSDWLDINRKLWDGRVPVHVKSDFYDAGKFLEGGTSLTKKARFVESDIYSLRLRK